MNFIEPSDDPGKCRLFKEVKYVFSLQSSIDYLRLSIVNDSNICKLS